MSVVRQVSLTMLTLVVLCFGSAITAQADTVVFNNRTDFNAATSNTTTITFNGIAPPYNPADGSGGFVSYGPGASITLSGVTFSADPNSFLFVIDESLPRNSQGNTFSAGGASGGGFLAVQSEFPYLSTLNITFSDPVVAARFDTTAYTRLGEGAQGIARLSNGQQLTYSRPNNNEAGFFGFTTDPGITLLSLTIVPNRSTNEYSSLNLDDFTFQIASNPAVIPEPATMLLLGTGLAGVAAGARRRRKAAGRE